jgi:hypothetical protein
MPQLVKSTAESSTRSVENAEERPALPRGKVIVESHTDYAPLARDPKTGKPIPPTKPRIK